MQELDKKDRELLNAARAAITKNYDGEKFVYFDGNLFEVKTMGKAKLPTDMLLNVQESSDIEAKKAVEEWINANL